MCVTFQCQRQINCKHTSETFRHITSSYNVMRVGMRETGHVFCVVSILLRYKSGPNLFTVARCLTFCNDG